MPTISRFREPRTVEHFAALLKFLVIDQFKATVHEEEHEDGSTELQMEMGGNAAEFTVIIKKD
jgi:hypothetical protein